MLQGVEQNLDQESEKTHKHITHNKFWSLRLKGSIKHHNDILSAFNSHKTPFVSDLDRKWLLLIMDGVNID